LILSYFISIFIFVSDEKLLVRPDLGGDDWPKMLVALTKISVSVIETVDGGEHFRLLETYPLHSDCKLTLTNLKDFSFQIAFSEKILHLAATNKDQREYWRDTVNSIIESSSPVEEAHSELSYILHREALSKIDQDVYYDVVFEEQKPLVKQNMIFLLTSLYFICVYLVGNSFRKRRRMGGC
jgi:hypothetical protein